MTSDRRLVDCSEDKLKNEKILGSDKPVLQITKTEKFQNSVAKLAENFINKVGSGDLSLESAETTDEYMMGSIYGLYYSEDDEMYGVTFGIDNNEAYALFQKDCIDFEEFRLSKELCKPLESEKNLATIEQLFNELYEQFNLWVKISGKNYKTFSKVNTLLEMTAKILRVPKYKKYLCIDNSKILFNNDYSIVNNIKDNKEIVLELKGADNTSVLVSADLGTKIFKIYQNNKSNGINFSGDFKSVIQYIKNYR